MNCSGQFVEERADRNTGVSGPRLERLTHSAVRTSIRASGKSKFASFHWLESWTEIVEEETQETKGMTITLPLWLYQGILEQGGVLTIHEDYFLLTGGLERWLYRVARKHAGKQPMGWQFTMRQLYDKSGSLARSSDFALDIRKIAASDHLPEYTLELGRNGEGYRGALYYAAAGAADGRSPLSAIKTLATTYDARDLFRAA